MKNIKKIWAVQPYSGADFLCFRTEDKAKAAYDNLVTKVNVEFKLWLATGETSGLIIESTLESDCSGGCYHSYAPHECNFPSPPKFYAPCTAEQEWFINPPADLWGDPATARP